MNKKTIIFIAVLIALGILIIGRHSQGSLSGSLDEQMVNFLQRYVQINTTHPVPDYSKALTFLEKQAEEDGFDYQEVLLPSGKIVLVISFRGTDPQLPSLALNHHMDVVPATDDKWIKLPFVGEICDGQIIGRGTQDMKGIGVTHYFALKELKEQGVVPRRTIHIFAVPDEEIGGFTGTKQFVETEQFRQLNVGFVVDEGHSSGDSSYLDLKIAERKPIQVQITGKGTLSHGSHLQCHNVVHDLLEFLNEIVIIHHEQQQQAGKKQDGALLSCNVTSLTAGIRKENGHVAMNMVPDEAQATIDIRVPPTRKKSEVLALFENIIKKYPHLTYQIMAQADEEPELNDNHSELYQALEQAINKFGLQAKPHFFEASSDLRFYQAKRIDGIGLSPFTIEDNVHGINESVPVEQLIRGKNLMLQFLRDFCY